MVTIKSVKERLEYYRRLALAGVSQSELDLGPAVILWTRTRAGVETWEVLPRWMADLIVSGLHNDATVERAAVYHRIPKNAPMDVAAEWLRARTGQAIPMPNVTNQILAA